MTDLWRFCDRRGPVASHRGRGRATAAGSPARGLRNALRCGAACLLLALGAVRVAQAGPAETGPVEPGPVETGPVEPGPVEPGAVEPGPQSRFQRTAAYLQGAEPGLQAEFAALALQRLREAYVAEAEQARAEAQARDGDAKLLAWSRAVENYASRLSPLVEDIEMGFPVYLEVATGQPLAIIVAQRTVILSHPRMAEQALFEQALLDSFCRRHRCDQFTAADPGRRPIPLSAGRVRPGWSFNPDGPVCTYGGVRVLFSAGADLPRARMTCEQLLVELIGLAHDIAWQQRHGVEVAWDELQLRQTRGGPGHQLRLNDFGDTLLVTLPLLYSSPGLLPAAAPWLRSRVEGSGEVTLELGAADFGWE